MVVIAMYKHRIVLSVWRMVKGRNYHDAPSGAFLTWSMRNMKHVTMFIKSSTQY